MSDEDIVNPDTSNGTADDTNLDEVSDTENNEAGQSDSANEEHDLDWYKQQNEKLFARAKMAEGFSKDKDGNWVKKPKAAVVPTNPVAVEKSDATPQITPMDTIALVNAKVTEQEDVETVMEYAKFKGISITEALKTGVIRAELSERAEERKSAQVANTGGSRRTPSKLTGDQLLNHVRKGGEPKTDEDWEALYRAKRAQRG